MRRIEKPAASEYAPHASRYIGPLPDDGLVLSRMRSNAGATAAFLRSLPEQKLLYRYAPGKWTIKEVLLHVADDERIYAYRALRFARGDSTELPGFDQDAFTLASNAGERTLESLLAEFATVRDATLSLFEGLGSDVLLRSGVADGSLMTVRAIAYHIAGHELWHMGIVRERYL
jgi:uncharacterized damage-inducible protein DinB